MYNYQFYSRSAEDAAKATGTNMFQYERRVMPYVRCLEDRRDAMRSGDVAMFQYVFSASFDAEKHHCHDQLVEAVKELKALGVYTGAEDRYEMARFACIFVGESDLINFVD